MRKHDSFLRSGRAAREEDHDRVISADSEVSGSRQGGQSVHVVARWCVLVVGGLEFVPRDRRHAHAFGDRRR